MGVTVSGSDKLISNLHGPWSSDSKFKDFCNHSALWFSAFLRVKLFMFFVDLSFFFEPPSRVPATWIFGSRSGPWLDVSCHFCFVFSVYFFSRSKKSERESKRR